MSCRRRQVDVDLPRTVADHGRGRVGASTAEAAGLAVGPRAPGRRGTRCRRPAAADRGVVGAGGRRGEVGVRPASSASGLVRVGPRGGTWWWSWSPRWTSGAVARGLVDAGRARRRLAGGAGRGRATQSVGPSRPPAADRGRLGRRRWPPARRWWSPSRRPGRRRRASPLGGTSWPPRSTVVVVVLESSAGAVHADHRPQRHDAGDVDGVEGVALVLHAGEVDDDVRPLDRGPRARRCRGSPARRGSGRGSPAGRRCWRPPSGARIDRDRRPGGRDRAPACCRAPRLTANSDDGDGDDPDAATPTRRRRFIRSVRRQRRVGRRSATRRGLRPALHGRRAGAGRLLGVSCRSRRTGAGRRPAAACGAHGSTLHAGCRHGDARICTSSSISIHTTSSASSMPVMKP